MYGIVIVLIVYHIGLNNLTSQLLNRVNLHSLNYKILNKMFTNYFK